MSNYSTKKLHQNELAQFTGSEQWYRHGINRKVVFTDGAKYVADQAGAYWLLDGSRLFNRTTRALPPKNSKSGRSR